MVSEKLKANDSNLINIPSEDLNWSTVKLSEVKDSGFRIEASFFYIEGKHAKELIDNSIWEKKPLVGNDSFGGAYYLPRFKRMYVEKSNYPMLLPGQINEINPPPTKYLSERNKDDYEKLRVKKGQILLTRSGTTGNVTLVSNTLNNQIFSDDLIRINLNNEIDVGYVYTFLKTSLGRILIKTNDYGAVISHIEPEHLENIKIPNPPDLLKRRIHQLIIKSYDLRDDSNELIDRASKLLIEELKLQKILEESKDNYESTSELLSWGTKLSNLDNRLDGSYHKPVVNKIISAFYENSKEVVQLKDIVKEVVLPGRFTRVYVEEGQGTKFLGGKDIFQLNPTTDKYLSNKNHKKRIEKELEIRANSILTPSRGSLGRVLISPEHFEGWTISDNIIQIIPSNNDIIGYIFCLLNTELGKVLIQRYTYGGVVDALEEEHINSIPIPLLKDKDKQKMINDLVLKANNMRFEAYKLEEKAIKKMEKEVIFQSKKHRYR